MEILSSKVIEHLECPVCNEYLSAPIKQCLTGHSICNQCAQQLANCPQCRAKFSGVRNFTLEALIENLLINCPNCQEGIKINDTAHKLVCKKETIDCKLSFCSWRGERENLCAHIQESHWRLLFESGTKFASIDSEVIIIQRDNYTLIRKVIIDNQIFWAGQHLLQTDKKYLYSVKLTGDVEVVKLTQTCKSHDMNQCDVLKKINMIGMNIDFYITNFKYISVFVYESNHHH